MYFHTFTYGAVQASADILHILQSMHYADSFLTWANYAKLITQETNFPTLYVYNMCILTNSLRTQ